MTEEKPEKKTTEEQAKIKELASRIRKVQAETRKLQKQYEAQAAKNKSMEPVVVLLDNLVIACEAGDVSAIEQTAGAGREFLDQNRNPA